jgi:hypothetical protein
MSTGYAQTTDDETKTDLKLITHFHYLLKKKKKNHKFECLLSKREALSSSLSTAKTKTTPNPQTCQHTKETPSS